MNSMIIHVKRFGVPLHYILGQFAVNAPRLGDAISLKRFSGVRVSAVFSRFGVETLKYIKTHQFPVADFLSPDNLYD